MFESFLERNAHTMDDQLLDFFTDKGSHPDMDHYLYAPLKAYTSNGGKRHRPLICCLACEAVGGNPADAISTAVAIEYFHTAALIHDDIADEALLRRGEPCIHTTEGIGLAINAGDLALSLVTGSVVYDEHLDDKIKLRVLRELIDMTTHTIEGQALDIGWARDSRFDLGVADYLTMARHKTAFYSGGVPLAVGAIIGKGSEQQVEGLREFGMSTGLAFQIQDDLLNLIGSDEKIKKDFRGDITEGKRTLMVVHALQYSSARDELVSILSEKTTNPAQLERAVQIMTESGSLDFAREYALSLTASAKERIFELLDKGSSRELLLSMADYFVRRMN